MLKFLTWTVDKMVKGNRKEIGRMKEQDVERFYENDVVPDNYYVFGRCGDPTTARRIIANKSWADAEESASKYGKVYMVVPTDNTRICDMTDPCEAEIVTETSPVPVNWHNPDFLSWFVSEYNYDIIKVKTDEAIILNITRTEYVSITV